MAFAPSAPPTATTAWPLALAAVLLALGGLIFSDTLAAMASVWRTSESFAHGPLVPLATLWLVWRRRSELANIPIRPWWPALAAIAIVGFGWLLGRLAGVNTVEQFAVVAMIPALVAFVFGWRIAWAIAFPLAFLFFAVPFGTFMLPTLMDWTADFTVAAIRATGIPVLREGTSFTLPTGRWSVVESCSGIRYLLAALPLSCIYAYMSYESYRARVLFIGLAVAVALVANWIRAFIIVMLGHFSGMKIAVGADHLVYGWVFFGIVMALTFWLGGFVRDPASRDAKSSADPASEPRPAASSSDAARPPAAAAAATAHAGRVAAQPLLATFVAVALLASLPATATRLHSGSSASLDPSRIAGLLTPLPQPDDPDREYRPDYRGAAKSIAGTSIADPAVFTFVAQYVGQHDGSEMIHEDNRVMPGGPDNARWQIRSRGGVNPATLGAAFPRGEVNEYVILGPDGRHLVWEWFQVDGQVLASPSRVKIRTALAVLSGRGDESLAWFVWTRLDGDLPDARKRLAAETGRLGTVPLHRSE